MTQENSNGSKNNVTINDYIKAFVGTYDDMGFGKKTAPNELTSDDGDTVLTFAGISNNGEPKAIALISNGTHLNNFPLNDTDFSTKLRNAVAGEMNV